MHLVQIRLKWYMDVMQIMFYLSFFFLHPLPKRLFYQIIEWKLNFPFFKPKYKMFFHTKKYKLSFVFLYIPSQRYWYTSNEMISDWTGQAESPRYAAHK